LASLVNQGSAYTIAGVVPQRMGNDHPSIAPYGVFAARDGALVLAVGNDRQYGTLCNVLGAAELAVDPRFATNADRVRHRVQLVAALEQRLSTNSAASWASALTEMGVPAGPVNDIAAAFALGQRLGLDPIVDVPAADGEPVRLTRNPIGLSRTPPTYRIAPPRLPGRRDAVDADDLWDEERE
jgi:crotonobetainyl-CoA:carnitine CoA-transferase CaiB-like acyl-CoA transferase